MEIGADCSMGRGSARDAAQQRMQVEEGRQGNLRGLGEAHVDASGPLGHPFRDDDEVPGDDDEVPGRRHTDERSVPGGRVMASGHGQRLAAEGMPRVVDGDRS